MEDFLTHISAEFIRGEFNNALKRAWSESKMVNQNRKSAGAVPAARWRAIESFNGGEIQKVKLTMTNKYGICLHLLSACLLAGC